MTIVVCPQSLHETRYFPGERRFFGKSLSSRFIRLNVYVTKVVFSDPQFGQGICMARPLWLNCGNDDIRISGTVAAGALLKGGDIFPRGREIFRFFVPRHDAIR